ncbi:Holin-like protein CidA [compost metagenome]
MLLFLYLLVRGEVSEPINVAASSLLRYLPLLLVPAAVGVMVYARQIAADFWAIAGALVLSLLLSFLFAGWLMQKLLDRQKHRREGA